MNGWGEVPGMKESAFSCSFGFRNVLGASLCVVSQQGLEFAHPAVSGMLSSFRIDFAVPSFGERFSYSFQCLVSPNVSARFDNQTNTRH